MCIEVQEQAFLMYEVSVAASSYDQNPHQAWSRTALYSTICLWPHQAFRHLYVLASEPRGVQAIDVDTKQSVYVPIRITLKGEPAQEEAPNAPAAPAGAPDGLSVGAASPCLLL